MNYIHTVAAGRMTKDADLRFTPSGKAVAKFTVVVNSKYKASDGTAKEEATFLECVAWNKTAELIGQYTRKGSEILVDGELKQENWDDKTTGQKRSKLVLTVGKVVFCGKREETISQPAIPAAAPKPATAASPVPAGEKDEVPF